MEKNRFDSTGSELIASPQDRTLMCELIDSAGFADLPHSERPNTFDDPYVGARLYIANVALPIGEHLKIEPGERHAEPQAILNALKKLEREGVAGAAEFLSQIESIYERKAWKTEKDRGAFEQLWADAGKLLRERYADKGLMRLFSTLEPCADYESQPSCACIIRAAGIAEVLYGCDDINPKGKGRQILTAINPAASSRIALSNPPVTVFSNVAVSEAQLINRLFFTSFKLAESFFESADRIAWNSQPQYAFFSLEAATIDPIVVERGSRVGIELSRRNEIGKFRVESQPWMTSIGKFHTEKKRNADQQIDGAMVLFCGNVAEGEVRAIVREHALAFGSIPGIIITSSSIEIQRQTELGQLIFEKKVRFHAASFQRIEKRADASRILYADAISNVQREPTIVLAKQRVNNASSTQYAFGEILVENPERLSELALPDQTNISLEVLTLFISGSHQSVSNVFQLLQDAPQITDLTRRHTVIVTTFADGGALRDALDRLPPGAYDRVEVLKHGIALTSDRLAQDVQVGLDPRSLLLGYVTKLAESISWIDRRRAGSLYCRAARTDRNFLSKQLVPRLINNCLVIQRGNDANRRSWPIICSILNAIHELYSSCDQEEIESFDGTALPALDACGFMLDAMSKGSSMASPWIIDITWRLLACLCSSPSVWQTNIGSHWKNFWANVSASSFLRCEAVCYSASSVDATASMRWLLSHLNLRQIEAAEIEPMLRVLARRMPDTGTPVGKEMLLVFGDALNDSLVSRIADFASFSKQTRIEKLASLSVDPIQVSQGRYADLTALLPTMRRLAIPQGTWRRANEHSLTALLELIPATHRIAALTDLMRDGDPTLRWAGLLELLRSKPSDFEHMEVHHVGQKYGDEWKVHAHFLRNRKTHAISELLSKRDIYWFDRELFYFYAARVNQARELLLKCIGPRHNKYLPDFLRELVDWTLPSLADLPVEPYIFQGEKASLVHPEVTQAIELWRKFGRTVALVLPPIEFEQDETGQRFRNKTATPPLGLGSIATTLAAQGHFVKIFDAHHYRYTLDSLAGELSAFDVVGISVVQSTERSSKVLSDSIRSRPGPKDRLIVHGGHARTLYSSDKALRGYDEVIRGPGEIALSKLIFEAT